MKNGIKSLIGLMSGLSMIFGLGVVLHSNHLTEANASSYNVSSVPTDIDLNDSSDSEIRSYYSSLSSLSESERKGTNLLKNLKPILKKGQKYLSYGSGASTAVWQAYEIVDRDWDKSPASDISGYNSKTNKISGYTYGKSNTEPGTNPYVHALYVNRNVENETKAWGNHNQDQWGINQEHIWAKSLGFQDSSHGVGARGDIMHLWAGNGKVNGTYHSNYYYGYVDTSKEYNDASSYVATLSGNLKGYSKTLGGTATTFEPQDSDKGDIARALFYMAARYNYLSGSDSDGIDSGNPNLEIVNDNTSYPGSSSYTSTETKTGKIGIIQDLLEWNRLDPPDEWEIHRNNLCYKNFTGNRNPFIDFPEWAEYVWGSSSSGEYDSEPTGSALPSGDSINSFDGDESSNPTVNYVTVSPTTLKLDLNGTSSGALTATVSVSNDASKTVNWSSSNPSVATVSSGGIVIAKLAGTATIRAASAYDTSKYAECVVTVTDSSQGREASTGNIFTIGWGSATGEEGTYQNFAETSGNVDGILSFSTAKNDGTALPAYNSNNLDLRLYCDNKDKKGNGGSITITPESGVTFTKAIVKTTTQPSVGYFVDDGEQVTISGNNNTYTIENINASKSLTLKNAHIKTDDNNPQLRIKTIQLTYDVEAKEATKILSSISLDTSNVKKTFNVGDTFSSDGLVVTANYNDGSSKIVTPTSISAPDMSSAGNKSVTVTYKEGDNTKIETYEITVNGSVSSLSASVDKVYHPGDRITKGDIKVIDNLGNEITGFNFSSNNYQFTYDDAPSGGSAGSKTFKNAISYSSYKCDLTVSVTREAHEDPVVSDTITADDLAATNTNYTDFSNVSKSSGALYAGQSAKQTESNVSKIQLRSNNNNSGIVSTKSGGRIMSVEIVDATKNGRTINIYAKNEAYESASDLYDTSKQGTLVGSVSTDDGGGKIQFASSYSFVGIRSASGAVYISSIVINYEGDDTAENVSNYIMFEDNEMQCEGNDGKLNKAMNMLNSLQNAEKTSFWSSNDYVIETARTRIKAWAIHEGKTLSYSGGSFILNAKSISNLALGEEDDKASSIVFVAVASGLALLSFYALIRIRKKNNNQ